MFATTHKLGCNALVRGSGAAMSQNGSQHELLRVFNCGVVGQCDRLLHCPTANATKKQEVAMEFVFMGLMCINVVGFAVPMDGSARR